MDKPPTNDLIVQLEEGLSPTGRRALEEINALEAEYAETAPEAGLDKVAEILRELPSSDREIVARISLLKAHAHEGRAAEYLEDARQSQLALAVIERAQELERGAGFEPSEDMTLREALTVLELHGEDVPEIDAQRVVVIPPEETRRDVPAFYPDFADADTWRRWDGSEQAEAWAKLRDIRDKCIDASVGEVAGMDFRPIDYAGVIAALWGIEKDEAAELVRRRQGY
jgi:hypothetical protein